MDSINTLVVQCDHCSDWFEPKIFTMSDVAKLSSGGSITVENQYVHCKFCEKKTFVSQDRFKPI